MVSQTLVGGTGMKITLKADNKNLDATIQNEWFRETAGEGLRMSCLKRWGIGYTGRSAQAGAIAGAVLQQTPSVSYVDKSMPATDYHYQWPIPGYEMKINPNLVQNPGYDD